MTDYPEITSLRMVSNSFAERWFVDLSSQLKETLSVNIAFTLNDKSTLITDTSLIPSANQASSVFQLALAKIGGSSNLLLGQLWWFE